MNRILAVLNTIAAKLVLSKKDMILTQMNKKINIPFASEADERELLEGIWELLEEAMGDAFNEK